MGPDMIYGQNDSFVLAWIVLSLWLWFRWQRAVGGAGCGLLLRPSDLLVPVSPPCGFGAPLPVAACRRRSGRSVAQAAGVEGALAGSLANAGRHRLDHRTVSSSWDPGAMIDDVRRWSNGTSDTAVQIWGWGVSNWSWPSVGAEPVRLLAVLAAAGGDRFAVAAGALRAPSA